MIAGVGITLVASALNTGGTKPAGDAKALPLEEKESSEATSVKAKAEKHKNTLSRPVEPISPSNLNILIGVQGDSSLDSAKTSPFDSELTAEEEKEVQELKQTDAEVRAHEAAHKTAGGPVAGNVSFQTVTGPDGREYAVAGEVRIDASPIPNNPEATVRKMDLVIRAALAPAEPSAQDRAVASQAQQTRLKAQQEASEERQNKEEPNKNNNLGELSNIDNLQNTEISVSRSGSRESGSDSEAEIVSILFGNSHN